MSLAFDIKSSFVAFTIMVNGRIVVNACMFEWNQPKINWVSSSPSSCHVARVPGRFYEKTFSTQSPRRNTGDVIPGIPSRALGRTYGMWSVQTQYRPSSCCSFTKSLTARFVCLISKSALRSSAVSYRRQVDYRGEGGESPVYQSLTITVVCLHTVECRTRRS